MSMMDDLSLNTMPIEMLARLQGGQAQSMMNNPLYKIARMRAVMGQRALPQSQGAPLVPPDVAARLSAIQGMAQQAAPSPDAGVSLPFPGVTDQGPPPGAHPAQGFLDRFALGLAGQQFPGVNPYSSQGQQFVQALLPSLARSWAGQRIAPIQQQADYDQSQAQNRAAMVQANLAAQLKAAEDQNLEKAKAANEPLVEAVNPDTGQRTGKMVRKSVADRLDKLNTMRMEQARLDIEQKNAKNTEQDLVPAVTPGGLDMVATLFAKTGQMPQAGMGKAGMAFRARVMNRAAELFPTVDLASDKASFSANQQSLRGLQGNLDATTAFENTALANAKNMMKAMEKIPDTGAPWSNQIARAIQLKAIGNADVAAFNAGLQTAAPEFARILSNPSMSGIALTDAMRKDIGSVLSGNYTRKQMASSLDILTRDAENRKRSYQQQIEAIRGRIGAAPGTFGPSPTTGSPYVPKSFVPSGVISGQP